MNQYVQEHLVSALQTFLAVFLTTLGTTLASGQIEWTWAFAGAIVLTAARTAVKVIFQNFAPVSLGGLKK